VRILWRGGRTFKPASTPDPKANGASKDAVMIIDSDDEQPPVADEVEFEDDEAEIDASKPFPPILQHIDLIFGTAATRLAASAALKDRIVFAAACADSSIRLVSLPLTPPSPARKAAKGNKPGKWGETVITLSGFSTPADAISMTYVKKDDEKARSEGSLLLASHSGEVSGLLLLHKVPILTITKGGKTTYQLSKDHTTPFQTQYLSTPASSIDFNHSTSTLLLASKTGTIRLYSPLIAEGSWLLTLHTPFLKSEISTFPSRKPILDAKFVLGGKSLLLLLSDGEWGVWDLESAGPGASKSILGGQTIKGGALTPFNLSGYISSSSLTTSKSTSRPSLPTSKFAPMTPATRRTVDPALFSSRSGHAASGGLSVVTLPKTSTTSPPDERVALWLEDAYAVIPSLRAFWDAQLRRGGNLFGGAGAAGGRIVRVEGVNLRGERGVGLAQAGTELVIAAEHRLVVVRDAPEVTEGGGHRIPGVVEGRMTVRGGDMGIAEIDQTLDRMDDEMALFARRKAIQS